MANHTSAKKRIVRNAKRALINKDRRSGLRTSLKKVESALAAGDATQAESAYKAVQPLLMRGVAKGIVEKNAAARKMSRLSARIKALKGKA